MLKAVLSEEDVGKLDESLRAHYRKTDDGSSILDVGGVSGVELQDVGALKTALSKERKAKSDAERRAKSLDEKFGDLDPEAARVAMTKMEELGDLDGDELRKKAIEAAKEDMSRKFARDKEGLDKATAKASADYELRIAGLTAQLTERLVTSEAMKAITEAKGSVPLLLPVIESQARVEMLDDGSFAVRLYDRNGNMLLSTKSGSTDPRTIDEHVEELRQDKAFSVAYAGANASGAGGSRSGQKTGAGGKIQISSTNKEAVSANIAKIASGEVEVVTED